MLLSDLKWHNAKFNKGGNDVHYLEAQVELSGAQKQWNEFWRIRYISVQKFHKTVRIVLAYMSTRRMVYKLEWKGTVEEFEAKGQDLLNQYYNEALEWAARLDKEALEPQKQHRFSVFDTIDPYQF